MICTPNDQGLLEDTEFFSTRGGANYITVNDFVFNTKTVKISQINIISFCSFFNKFVSMYISENNYEEFFSAFHFHRNDGHLGLYATHQCTCNFKTACSNAVKRCAHIEYLKMKELTKQFF